MKRLYIDIETRPNLGYVFQIWNQNIGLNQLREHDEMICFAYKWYRQPVQFVSTFADGKEAMVRKAHELLSEADVVTHYYGSRFDIPWLNREIALAGLTPPRPFKQIDLKQIAAKRFKFASNKLDHVAQMFGIGSKVHHEGFGLWKGCMDGDPVAWRRMERYNRQDVVLLEKLEDKMRPWLPDVLPWSLVDDTGRPTCNKCGAAKLRKDGFAYTVQGKFQQFRCSGCGGWARDTKRIDSVSIRGVAA